MLDNFAGENVSDKNKLSLMEDSRIFEESCDKDDCALNVANSPSKKEGILGESRHRKKPSKKAAPSKDDSALLSQVNLSDGEQSFESEDDDSFEDSSGLIEGIDGFKTQLAMDRDSMPNLGPNMVEEMRKKKKREKNDDQVIETGLKESDRGIVGGGLLPTSSVQKRAFENTTGGRYDDQG